MSPSRQVPWVRIGAEGLVIVASILLALAVDAWWGERQDRADAIGSLELIDRDLTEAIAQLEEFRIHVEGSLEAAVSVYEALSGPPARIDRARVSADLVRTGYRRTIALPTAAYTDLISTGNSRLISDAGLRDEILRFYASAERTEAIIERNNTALIEAVIWNRFFGGGLVLPRPGAETGAVMADLISDSLRVRLGDVEHRDDRLWSLPPDSPEWDSVRGAMLIFSRAAIASETVATETIGAATELRSRVRTTLGVAVR